MFAFSILVFLTSLLFSVKFSNGRIYTDENGTEVYGEDLLKMCFQSVSCNTHLQKNVYATSRPVLDHEWTPLLFPEMYDQFNSESTCGSGSKFISMDSCCQIHSPMTPYHPQGNVKVSYVEEQYSLKWQNIRNSKTPIYDSFLDNSIAFWVDDIGKYSSLWTEIGADVVYLKWTVNNKFYYSIITHNGDTSTGSTLTQYELISDKFNGLTSDIFYNMIDSEQRAFFDENTNYRTSFENNCQTIPIGARRSVSSVDDNISWYKKIFASSITDESKQIITGTHMDYNGNIVKYGHIKLYPSEESTTISFFERDLDDSTFGEFNVLDFEMAMTDTHNENMISPYCGIDRWFDMHYAIGFDDIETSEKILSTIMLSGEKYTVYEAWEVPSEDNRNPTYVYMTEPNGHSVQLNFNGANINWLTSPQSWDSDWCPMECTNEMLEYNYGDIIATFTWQNENDNDNDKQEQKEEKEGKMEQFQQEEKTKNYFVTSIIGKYGNTNQIMFSLIFVILALFSVLAIALKIGYDFNPHCDRFKYEELPQ